MGRELKRVPLDFDWPHDQVWPGFLFYHRDDCPWTLDGGYTCGKSWHDHVEPPAGDGYQLWENVSEGSPVSPVFDTLDALCDWAEGNMSTFGTDYFTTAAEWKRMLSTDGFTTTWIGPNIVAI